MRNPSLPLRSVLHAATALVSLACGSGKLAAQSGTVIAQTYALDLAHAKAYPYNFTGRVFDNVNIAFGSGTLIRRHTVLTAGHVVFDATTGFSTGLSFTRALFGNFDLSIDQVVQENVLSGFQAAETANDTVTLASGSRDMGYCLVMDAPVDENWANFAADETLLTNPALGRFILGYPGVSFDGRTMCYIVPTAPYVEVGTGDTGFFANQTYTSEPGNSGGPIYAYTGTAAPGTQAPPYAEDPTNYQVTAELVGGLDDPTGEFNLEVVRAITPESKRFLVAAEYTSGLIKTVKIQGPKTVSKGTTQIYTATPKFLVPNALTGGPASTTRYGEVKLQSNTPGTPTNPVIVITKVSNTQFQVKFGTQLRSGSSVILSAIYAKNGTAIPKATLTVGIQ